jgi:hypothetical protein
MRLGECSAKDPREPRRLREDCIERVRRVVEEGFLGLRFERE